MIHMCLKKVFLTNFFYFISHSILTFSTSPSLKIINLIKYLLAAMDYKIKKTHKSQPGFTRLLLGNLIIAIQTTKVKFKFCLNFRSFIHKILVSPVL